ncbi:hypothetical protein CHUAL_005605 [Chamberlinius hualienensis]
MFPTPNIKDDRLLFTAHQRRLLDNRETRPLIFAKNELPSHKLGAPTFLLNYSKKIGNSSHLLDRKSLMTNNEQPTCEQFLNLNTKRESLTNVNTNGPSSLKVFAGEDPTKNIREEISKKNQRMWLDLQMREKVLHESRLKSHQDVVDKSFTNYLEIMKKQDKQEKVHEKTINKAIENFNQRMSFSKLNLRNNNRYREEKVNNNEMISHIESNILNEENRSRDRSQHGFLPHQRSQIWSCPVVKVQKEEGENMFQRKEKLEKRNEDYWNKRDQEASRSHIIEERQHKRSHKEQKKLLMMENLRLMEEQKITQAKTYKCMTEDSFYQQFEKSYR